MLIYKKIFFQLVLTVIFTGFFSIVSAENPPKVLIFGDSLIHGYGLPQTDGFVNQMQSFLNKENQKIELINGGVSGDTTAGGLARINWSLTPGVAGALIVLGGNDMLRGIDPVSSKSNLEGILQILVKERKVVILAGMQSSNNFGSDYKNKFDQMYIELAQKYNLIFYPNFLKSLFDSDTGRIRLELLQEDGIHPNAEGVERIVRDLAPRFLDLISEIKAKP